MTNYEIIVTGIGHSGYEAASVLYNTNIKSCIITPKISNIGDLSCNPSIGGIAKSIVLEEINVLRGQMLILGKFSGINYKKLNKSRGSAVWGNRVQVDRTLYKRFSQFLIIKSRRIDFLIGKIKNIVVKDNILYGILCENNKKILSNSVLIALGTFSNGIIHVGYRKYRGGRLGECDTSCIVENIFNFAFSKIRLKTGTPPRIYKNSINFSKLQMQKDSNFRELLFNNIKESFQKQLFCGMIYTNHVTHTMICNNITQSSIYIGNSISSGPKYCPSIEDKIIKFRQKNRHRIFLEIEGIESEIVYPNGISTSLPKKIQQGLIRSIKGLNRSKFSQYGYAIEYDCINPNNLSATLESSKIHNLFFTGQINGSTGYEEAALQGVISSINSMLKINYKRILFSNINSYIGSMVHDITHFNINEPYRVTTSRSKNKVINRPDNAFCRMMQTVNTIYGRLVDNIQYIRITLIKELIFKIKYFAYSLRTDIMYFYNILIAFIFCVVCCDTISKCMSSNIQIYSKYFYFSYTNLNLYKIKNET